MDEYVVIHKKSEDQVCDGCGEPYNADLEGVYVDDSVIFPNAYEGWTFDPEHYGSNYCYNCGKDNQIPAYSDKRKSIRG